MADTKKPSGLTITRSGSSFTLKWKIRDSDHGDGQKVRYKIKTGSSWSGWTTLTKSTSPSISATQTSLTVTLTLATLKAVKFQVCGNRKKYTKNGKTIDPGWSDWASKTWEAKVPSVTSLTYENTGTNSGTFEWEAPSERTDKAIFTRIEAQTCYVRNNSAPSATAWGSLITKSAKGSQTISEDTEAIAAGNIVRWYRVRAVGPAGASAWKTAKHAYGSPTGAEITSASAETISSATRLTVEWTGSYDSLKPIDKITVQYVIAVPTDTALTAPAAGWSDAIEVSPNGSMDKVIVNVSNAIGVDECLWVRIASEHDTTMTYSAAVVAQVGALAAPGISATADTTTGGVSIIITKNTSCAAACTAIFFRSEDDPSNDRIIAILPSNTTTVSVTVEDVIGAATTCFGAYAFVGTYTGLIIEDVQMVSASAIDSDIASVAPATVTVTEGPREGTVRIGWAWSWAAATRAELSWAEYEDAWESTSVPNTFTVDNRFATSWIITDLAVGQRWFFRVRLLQVSGDETVTGPWSPIISYNLSGAPDRPALMLSRSVINEGETVTARWGFSSTDGTAQAYAEICTVTFDQGGNEVYGDVIAHVDAGQSVELAEEWTTGTTYYFAVRTTAASGVQSAWSEPASLYVTDPVAITLGAHSFVTTIVDGETVYTLQAMPLTATVTGAGSSGTTILSIVRADDYHIDRPDDNDFDGYEGETIVTYSQTGEGQISIGVGDLLGSLDDGAAYSLVLTVIDEFDQTASLTVPFNVNWAHKAGVPSVTIETDRYMRITKITPIAPAGYAAGDTCDIYRLTADKPELIYEGAEFGETYVDPYPAFGEAAGHRLVTITANGDYATADGIGWYDTDSDDGDVLDDDQMVIDVDGEQIILPYNLTLSNRWSKDFKRTSYLGGSVQGDWNPAVTRDLTANTVLVRGEDLDRQVAMRGLAGFAGVAHVRTPDCSSLTANIAIQENQNYNDKLVSYTLTIQAIDPEEPDGMTLDEWIASHPIGV